MVGYGRVRMGRMADLHVHISASSNKVLHHFIMPIAGSTVQCS